MAAGIIPLKQREIATIIQRQPLIDSLEHLSKQFGQFDVSTSAFYQRVKLCKAESMLKAVRDTGRSDLTPALAVPGIGTRWNSFATWITGFYERYHHAY